MSHDITGGSNVTSRALAACWCSGQVSTVHLLKVLFVTCKPWLEPATKSLITLPSTNDHLASWLKLTAFCSRGRSHCQSLQPPRTLWLKHSRLHEHDNRFEKIDEQQSNCVCSTKWQDTSMTHSCCVLACLHASAVSIYSCCHHNQ
jgi:hypothetical protein